MQISINAKPELIEAVDEARDKQSRSGFISDCIKQSLSGQDVDNTQLIEEIKANKATNMQLIAQIESYKATIETQRAIQTKLENEIEFLHQEYSKINDALAQRLLTDSTQTTPKRSLWSRIFRTPQR